MKKGKVFKSTGSWYSVYAEDGVFYNCRARGKFKQEDKKVTNPVTVGDNVVFFLEDHEENTGVITEILPRHNYIIRKAIKKSAHGQLLAANIDQAIIIATLTLPRTSLGFIDRILVTAETFRIPTTIVFNKQDLMTEEMFEELDHIFHIYEKIGYSCHSLSAQTEEGIQKFKKIIENKTSLLTGHSGVGKSTILNILSPQIEQQTKEISTYANKGVHTTTFAEMFEVAPNTFVIDSPGIKELGLLEVEPEELDHYFPEMRSMLGQCKFHNCSHTHEPGCLVFESVRNGGISPSRYESYLSMLEKDDSHRQRMRLKNDKLILSLIMMV